ncbi:hypothetical protein [Tamlana sp. I1]|uniref:hypothetical protein n=1 Tax=Tamlana sp. I1 TaxID=2762061 RepID=UPI00188F4A11|nr:hypothetical protein [Tamlana sp. I1]
MEKVHKDEQHIPNTPDFEAFEADKIETAINHLKVDKKLNKNLIMQKTLVN